MKATKYTDETLRALKVLNATGQVIKVLDPLSDRAKKRVLNFFCDLVTDPDAKCDSSHLEILKKVAAELGIQTRL